MIAHEEMTSAEKLAAQAIGIDSHIDTVQRVLVMGEDLSKRWDVGHVDIPRLREGGMHAPFFAMWVPVYYRGAEAVRRTLDLSAKAVHPVLVNRFRIRSEHAWFCNSDDPFRSVARNSRRCSRSRNRCVPLYFHP